MEKLTKSLSRYLMMSAMALLLLLFGATTAFAAGDTGSTVEETTGAAESEEEIKTEEMLNKLDNITLTAGDTVYSGSYAEPSVKLIYKNGETNSDVTEEFVFETFCNDINAGAAAVTAEVTGYYNEKKIVSFDSPVSLEPAEFRIKPASLSEAASLNLDKTEFTYNGTAQKPVVQVSATGTVPVKKDDYSIKYTSKDGTDDITSAGTKTVTVTGIGNFTGTLTKSYTIRKADFADLQLSAKVSSVIYITDGKTARKPNVTEVSVKLASGTKRLTSADYEVKSVVYENNVNAGKATARIIVGGRGINYTGTAKEIQAAFTIRAASVSVSDVTYNGKAQTPSVTVKAAGKTLSGNKDYRVTYKNNTNAGKAYAVITFLGSYKGTLTKNFTVKPRSISGASVALTCTKYTYTGKDRKPGITLKMKLSSVVTLKNHRDYEITYSKDCKSIGTKKVVIKGKGNYSGQTKTFTYTVVPETASGLKVTDRSSSRLSLSCRTAKTSGCRYEFLLKKYNSSSKQWETVSTKKVTSNSASFSGLSAGNVYACYVRIYKTSGTKTYTGRYSTVMKTCTSPARTVMSYASKTGSSSMKAVWKGVSASSGYEVQYSTKSDFSSNAKTVVVKGRTTASKTISGLNSSSPYYVRVRAYRTYAGKTYRGEWSSSVSTYYSNVYASYTTYYNSGNTNRSTNLRLACNAINGTILENGDTFSFNRIVGERTAAKGYREAIIYEGGQEVGGIGGGICQVATTLFNAALRANFTIVERYQHSMTVHYCPLGYDAAISWGSKNLKFRNNSGTSVKVDIHASGGTLSVKFLTNVYKKPPAVTTKVTVRNGVYTLRRYVNGQVNYTTRSDYLDN
ncbi:MAG: VanW family protein [Lachnospiraceae bacterium]|nr:VanW family protein [Lachnospiraceae bacterium]